MDTSASGSEWSGEGVSSATVARLSRYLQCLVGDSGANVAAISSDRLAELASVGAATVRRDLASLGLQGTRGLGYDVKYLVHEFRRLLGVADAWAVVIIGAGNLGRALANYDGLAARGFPVRALIDIDPELVGSAVGGLTVRHLDDLPALVGQLELRVGVIATPAAAAQSVADRSVEAGLISLLNFTATPLLVPVEVRQVDLATELQILSFYQRRTAAAAGGTGVPLS